MRTLTFEIKEVGQEAYVKQFNTDRSIQWTVKQYSRHRQIQYMNLIE